MDAEPLPLNFCREECGFLGARPPVSRMILGVQPGEFYIRILCVRDLSRSGPPGSLGREFRMSAAPRRCAGNRQMKSSHWIALFNKTNRPGLQAAAALFVLALLTPPVWCWGPVGHRVTARFAEERLTPRALAAVRGLLERGVRIEDAATWADEQREVRGSESWHYVNVPLTAARYEPGFCPSSGCVVSKIEEFTRVLRDPKAGLHQKRQALNFLLHFVADLHQPLHVGDNGDRGGNLLQVLFFDRGTNLHSVWDSKIMERHTDNKQVWLWDMTFLANPRMVAEWSKGTPRDWASESLAVAKAAYHLPGKQVLIRPGTKLGNEYYRFALPIVQRQLAKAGVRLAYTLNGIYK